MNKPFEGTKDSAIPADDDFDTSENRELVSCFLKELERLTDSENGQKDPVFDKAARLGIDLIKGNNNV